MSSQNSSIQVTEFVIGGFDTTKMPVLVGVVILIIYVVATLANIVNIVIIVLNKNLHKPMYLLICNLAVVDILYTSSVSPTMIKVLITGSKTISYVPCFIQMFSFHLGGVMESLALTVMAFDRFIAIACPFRYHKYLTNSRIIVLVYILWIIASGFASVGPAIVSPLPRCYLVLRYTFCSYPAVVRTTCVDPTYYFNLVAILILVVTVFTFGFICLSYTGIIFFVKLSSYNDKMKMGSTCLSHLIVVICYYVPLFVIALLTRLGVALTIEARDALNIGSIMGSTLVNPFVYCLRTKQIKNEIIMMMKRFNC